jgi:hypothetical protein
MCNNTVKIQNIKMVNKFKNEGKAISLQAWTGPEGSRRSAHEGGKVVSPTHRPPLLLLEAESAPEE